MPASKYQKARPIRLRIAIFVPVVILCIVSCTSQPNFPDDPEANGTSETVEPGVEPSIDPTTTYVPTATDTATSTPLMTVTSVGSRASVFEEYPISDSELSPDGQYLAIATNASIFIYTIPDLRLFRKLPVFQSSNSSQKDVFWSPDSQLLGVGYEKMVVLWSLESGTTVNEYSIQGNNAILPWDKASQWSPDQQVVAIGTFSGLIMWNPFTDSRSMITRDSLNPEEEYLGLPIDRMAWAPSGNQIAFNAYNDLWIWDVRNAEVTYHTRWEPRFSPTVEAFKWTTLYRDESFIFAQRERVLRITESGQEIELFSEASSVLAFIWSTNQNLVAVGTSDGTILVRNSISFEVLDQFMGDGPVRDIVFARDDTFLIAIFNSGLLQLWNLDRETSVTVLQEGGIQNDHEAELSLSPSQNILVCELIPAVAIEPYINAISVWDLSSRRQLGVFDRDYFASPQP